jgi:probable rRNA maturation factor
MGRSIVSCEVRVEAPAWRKMWPNASREARQFLFRIAKRPDVQPVPEGVVVIVLTDDVRVRALNSKFRRKDQATNVLSFPDPSVPLGGMVLALETLENEGRQQGKLFINHVKHMILHGFLHLLGHDHQTKSDARLMERLEIAILGEMGIPNPYVIEAQTRA